jgi:hypothetical protein
MQALLVLALPAMLAAGRLHLHLRATDRQLQQLRAARATVARRRGRPASNVVSLPVVRPVRQAA